MNTKLRMSWTKASKLVEAFLHSKQADPDMEIRVYCWGRTSGVGPRVAEVDYFKHNKIGIGGSGSSFMQVDVPYGIAVCACAERLMIAYAYGDEAEEIADLEWRLEKA